MTYKYNEVRREICKYKPDKLLIANRTFNEIKNVFSFRFWIPFGISVIAIIAVIVLVFLDLYTWCLIPFCVILLIYTILDWLGEKIYNVIPRKAELKTQKENYQNYINKIQEILKNCGIETSEQIDCLKVEASEIISKFETRFDSVKVKISDLAFAIPLGALFESFWSSRTDVNQMGIIFFIICGLLVFSVMSIIRSVYIHFNKIQKDYYLRQVLYEICYLENKQKI